MDFKLNTLGETKSHTSDEIMGIDLGTTNSAVAVYGAGTVPKLLAIGANGGYTIPSCVRWDGFENGKAKFTVGAEAYKQRYMSNVIYSVKRMMGNGQKVVLRRSEDNCATAEELILTPAEVSAEILKHLKDKVMEFYKSLRRCVITVPAYFNQRQISDTLEAAKLADLDCVQILKEPTSASYIYSQLGYANSGSVLIYDLGGGTFDVTHMTFLRKDRIPQKLLTSLKRQYGIEIEKSGADVSDQYFCRVLGTYGDVNLGGDDIDRAFGDYLIERDGVTMTQEERERLYLRCEEFKKIGVQGMTFAVGEHSFDVTAEDLDKAVDKIFARTLELMRDINMNSIDTIVLVGGSTKSLRIRENLARVFPKAEISAVLDPDATVALGAGSVAKAIANDGALMYADVLPLPIGILVRDSVVDICIDKNTSMPHTAKRSFVTLRDNQDTVTLDVFQGLSENPRECTYLGRLTMTDIPKRPAGKVKVLVSFVLNGEGRLRIVSEIDGVQRQETLVIDNIFDVSKQQFSGVDTSENGNLEPNDDFEKTFMPILMDNEKAVEMFRVRRRKLASNEEVESLENELVELYLSFLES